MKSKLMLYGGNCRKLNHHKEIHVRICIFLVKVKSNSKDSHGQSQKGISVLYSFLASFMTGNLII